MKQLGLYAKTKLKFSEDLVPLLVGFKTPTIDGPGELTGAIKNDT